MGATTTLWVSRQKAMERLAEHRFSGLSDAQLEEWVNRILEDTLVEVRVTCSEDGPDDAELQRMIA